MERKIRCQGVILHDDYILLVKHLNHLTGNPYWWLPGGALEPKETQEECIVREIREETHLSVRVERLLFETEDPDRRYTYQNYVTYLCTLVSGKAELGSEQKNSPVHSILGADWYPLWDESRWEPGFYEEHILPALRSIQATLKTGS
jgi:8-oxo-dGTP diphosphatase